MPTRLKRWIVFSLLLGGALLLTEGIWLLGVQRYLQSKEFLESLQQPPWQFSFEAIKAPFPGYVRVKNLAIKMTLAGEASSLVLKDVALHLHLWSLLRQEVNFYSIHARNGEFSIQRDKTDAPLQTKSQGEAKSQTHEAVPQNSHAQSNWSVKVSDLRLDAIQMLLIHGLRVQGTGSLTGEITFSKDQRMSLDLSLGLKDAHVLQREKDFGHIKSINLDLNIESQPLEELSRRFLSHITGAMTLDAELADLNLFYQFLVPIPWLKLQGEGAHVQGNLKVKQDQLQAGSQLLIKSKRTRAHYLNQEASGIGTSTFTVDDRGTLLMSMIFAEYALRRLQQPHAEVNGQGLRLEIKSPHFKLSQPLELWQIELDMPPARISSLNYLNSFLPQGTGLQFKRGQGTLEAHLQAHSDPSLKSGGDIRFATKNFAVLYEETQIEGEMQAHLQINAINLKSAAFELKDSGIAFAKVRSLGGGDPWTGQLDIANGKMQLQTLIRFEGSLSMRSQDVRPLLATYSQQKSWPPWIQNFVKLKDLQLSFYTQVDKDNLTIQDLRGSAAKLTMQGWFQRLNQVSEGRLFLQYEGLKGGLGVKGKSYEFKLFADKNWLKGR